jgi:hypothetical protein
MLALKQMFGKKLRLFWTLIPTMWTVCKLLVGGIIPCMRVSFVSAVPHAFTFYELQLLFCSCVTRVSS